MKITDLPEELISCIGDFLDKKSLSETLLTCHRLHATLKNQLWRDVELHCQEQQPIDINNLMDNSNFVRRLLFCGLIPSEYFHVAFQNLHTVEVDYNPRRPTTYSSDEEFNLGATCDRQEMDLTTLIRLNPQIRHLHIDTMYSRSSSQDLWDAISDTLHQPKRLEYIYSDIPKPALPLFWKACAAFEEIFLDGDYIPYSPVLLNQTFPRLSRLSINTRSHLLSAYRGVDTSVEWFKLCPNLTHLHWTLLASALNWRFIEPFIDALEERTWRQLEDLSMAPIYDTDELISNIIRRLPPLKRLHLVAPDFAEESFACLQDRLFSSLRSLDLSKSLIMTSRMVLDTLLQCAPLEEFRAYHVSVVDVKATPQPWACVGLKELQVYFASDPLDPEANILVFEQLARLTKLEKLDVSADDYNWRVALPVEMVLELKSRGSLRMRLGSGLECLSMLRRLKSVSFRYTLQEMRTEEVEWMGDNWPMLQEVRGRLCNNASRHKELTDGLQERGVWCDVNTWFPNLMSRATLQTSLIHRSQDIITSSYSFSFHFRSSSSDPPYRITTMAGISDLPQELITMIADYYLDRRQRAQFARTSHSIYASLTHRLWKTIAMESDFPHYNLQHPHEGLTDIAPAKPIIAPSRLQQHSHLVQTLSLRGPFRQEYYSIKYPRLHTLVLHYNTIYHAPYDKKDTCDSVPDAVMGAEDHANGAHFIRLNPTIKDLQLVIASPQLPQSFGTPSRQLSLPRLVFRLEGWQAPKATSWMRFGKRATCLKRLTSRTRHICGCHQSWQNSPSPASTGFRSS